MNLQMEYISDKYNIYTNNQKNNWNLVSYFEGTKVLLKNGEKCEFWKVTVKGLAHVTLNYSKQTMYFILSYSLVDICQKGLTTKLWTR